MKLPSDPKEKKQIFVLAGIGGAFVLYALFAFGISPVLSKKAEARTAIDGLNDEIRKADLAIKGANNARIENRKILTQMLDLSSNYVLRARLGNYRLGAQEMVEMFANKAQVEIRSMGETVREAPPDNPGTPIPNAFKTYGMRLELECGLHDLVRFLATIEAANPYVCVSRLQIASQPDVSPKRHRISMDLDLPIWVEEEVPNKLHEELEKALAATAAP